MGQTCHIRPRRNRRHSQPRLSASSGVSGPARPAFTLLVTMIVVTILTIAAVLILPQFGPYGELDRPENVEIRLASSDRDLTLTIDPASREVTVPTMD